MAFRVLCAFKTEEIFEFVKSALSRFQCDLVKTTSESLALFLAQKNFPSLIISESELHGGSGVNLLREVKAEQALATIPFVFLSPRPKEDGLPTGNVTPDVPEGAELFMWYPIETHEFLSAIAKFLQEVEDNRAPETSE